MRKKRAEQRHILPDPKFDDRTVAQFINNLMWQGKKSVARAIFYDALDVVGERTGEEPLEVFRKAIANVSPAVEVKSRRVGGATYQVPTEVRPERRTTLGIRWLIRYARERREKGMKNRLAAAILAAANGEGTTVKKKEDTHRMADANKAFSHFRW
ncbi:30S ribosomal protein S7 [uncultured Paraglaciecola sp.]|uniref:30S ribosomal protein S7 n=1 Tax=uncultured Paraglaciecola sp. TaxID=1765024 RepID=UPI002621690C|nr:30S ribosomal protein S7 [uncultured Paraglaciecola sp.]